MLNRNEEGLLKYQKELVRMESLLHDDTEVASAHDLHKALEMRNLLQTGSIIAQAALMRKETRGGHVRTDYPQTNATAQWVMVGKAEDGSPNLQFVPPGSY
jgi:succinate dehydrogenase/fumarate reductase flavoprotein subunit